MTMLRIYTLLLLVMGLTFHFDLYGRHNTLPDTAYDCSRVQIQELAESEMTQEERVARLENNLVESVDEYTRCMEQVQQEMSQSGGQGSDGGIGGMLGNASSEGEDNQQSAASSSDPQTEQETNLSPENTTRRTGGGGADNQIIKGKDNDSIVCQILRDEIKNEQDSAKKADLTKQYKDYNCSR